MSNYQTKETDLAKGLLDDKYELFEMRTYRRNKYYVLRENTVYQRKNFHQLDTTRWLDNFSSKFKEADYVVYVPVATLNDGEYVGYNYEHANFSNRVLAICNTTNFKCYYPNLYWIDIGNHPYPKEVRFHHDWRQREFNKYCNKIIYANPDPSKAFLTPTELGL